MTADAATLFPLLDEIEAELVGLWPDLPEPSPEAVADGGAFGLATMAYAQWLRYVFLPIARTRITAGDLPTSSDVATQAVREFDGDDTTSDLIALLARFDAAFGPTTK